MSSERKTEVIRAQLLSKAALSPDESELYELTQLAGVTMDQQVFKIILDLLKLNVPPVAIIQTLRSMCSPHQNEGIGQGSATSDLSSALLDSISQSRIDLKQGSRSGRSDYSGRSERRESQDRSSSQDRLVNALNSYSQDGSLYSSVSSAKSSRDNSQTGPRSHYLSNDTTYGRNEIRSQDISSQISASRVDRYVTRRKVTSGSEDYAAYRNKENIKK